MSLTLAILKPNINAESMLEIIDILTDEGFGIMNTRIMEMDVSLASKLYKIHEGAEYYDRLIKFMTSGKCMALMLLRNDSVSHLRSIIPDIRAKYGISTTENAIHGSDSNENAKNELSLIFGSDEQ